MLASRECKGEIFRAQMRINNESKDLMRDASGTKNIPTWDKRVAKVGASFPALDWDGLVCNLDWIGMGVNMRSKAQ